MNNVLHIDFESRSEVPLGGQTSVGLHNYAIHPSTQLLLLAWAYGNEDVQVWRIGLEPMPDRLKQGLHDPDQKLGAFNSSFERYMLHYKLGITVPIERFVDPQPSVRYLSLPSSLGESTKILDVYREFWKDERGEELIKVFCEPTKMKGKRGAPVEYYFRNHATDPELWNEFIEYCRQDVVAERALGDKLELLKVFPLPQQEHLIWVFDQRVNDRGMPTDIDFVRKALELATREKKESIEAINQLTGLDNSNSPTQVLEWARQHGYKANSLRKEAVAAALKYDEDLTPLARQVLEARKAASSTSYRKLAAILRQVSPDGRLRNQFIYMGSSRCGRWSGNGFQFHNMARPTAEFEDLDNVDLARTMICNMDYEGIKKRFKSVLLTVKSVIRTAFVAEYDNQFNVCDLNAIETRVAAWVSGCQPLLDVFLRPAPYNDPYLDFATKMTGIPLDVLTRDYKSKDPTIKAAAKGHRQMAKPGVLGCVYRLSGGMMGVTKKGDPEKKGLWGYAENMGVNMTQAEAHFVVKMFREAYKEIPQMWYDLERAIQDVLDHPKTKRELGPNGCIKIDKIVSSKSGRTILRIQLPSGRYLHYIDAEMMEIKMPWIDSDGNEVYKNSFCYKGQDQTTKQWVSIPSHGGKTFENIVQGIARDILAYFLVLFENYYDLPICGHVHDEGISETKKDGFTGVATMELVMSQSIDCYPGLPLKAEGFESTYYHK